MSGWNISPRRTRSGLVICSSIIGEGETPGSPVLELGSRIVVPRLSPVLELGSRIAVPRLSPGSPVLGLGTRLVVPRLSLLGRGHGTGGSDQRGVEVVGRPAPQQRVAVAQEDEGPEIIDLSDDESSQEENRVPGNPQPVSPIGASFMEIQNNSRVEANFPITPQGRALMDITIDLTMSPTTSPTDPSPQNSSIASSSTVPPFSPSLSTIMCPVCMESINSIRMKGHHLLSTVCGHIFCSHCLPECIRLSPTCPTCRRKLSTRDYHQLYLQ